MGPLLPKLSNIPVDDFVQDIVEPVIEIC